MSNFALRLPDDLKEDAAELAKETGVSLNQFITNSLVGKVAAQKEASRFFKARAGRVAGGTERLREILVRAGAGNPPLEGDE